MYSSHVEVKCPHKPCPFVGKGIDTFEAHDAVDQHIKAVHPKPTNSPQAR